MRDEYDFSTMKSRKNPYAKKLKKQITIRLAVETIDYFKELSQDSGLPYQNLIDLYLEDCARNHKKLEVQWS
ncbi:antitoxin [Thiospirochaeta perfilievii]|uniref:Antitoxin n=1 Tax=Thiospirochaeta perfilievii TaxID=252967 RepID=A0A5C1QAI3_9SPIO|nr:BrnA antitoxin family protein [Thiospirochaeta perfilievii]QEN04348.1 antitoxin [Thiospirochaeta perfilievii]